MTDLLIRNARPLGGAAADILVQGGRIAALGPPGLAAPPGTAIEEAGGLLALPGMVEGHTHLDKTVWGMGWYRNDVERSLQARIDNERAERGRLGIDPARQAERLAREFLARGTTRIRSHVDVDTEIGCRHVEGVLAAREALRGKVEIQLVAFPQSGLLIRPGTLELLDRALGMGAEVVGGLDPCFIDRDPKGHLDAVFGLAQRHGRPVDIHLHEPGEMGAFSLELILERVRALGMGGAAVVSHAFCLGDVAPARADALYATLAREGVALATTAPPSRAVPSVQKAVDAGVVIFGGNDGIRDTWGPYGVPDMLQRAMVIGMKNDFRRDTEVALAFDCVAGLAARGCGFEGHGLAPGCRADLSLLEAETLAEAVAAQPPRRLVVSHGEVVARAAG